MCTGTGKRWIKVNRKTICPDCHKTIAKIGGHPDQRIPQHG